MKTAKNSANKSDRDPPRHRVSYWQSTERGVRYLYFVVGSKVQIHIEGRYAENAPGVPKKLDDGPGVRKARKVPAKPAKKGRRR